MLCFYGQDDIGDGALSVSNTEFVSNIGTSGGAMSVSGQSLVLTMTQNITFARNNATVDGGALDVQEVKRVNLNNVEFLENQASMLGGALSAKVSLPKHHD